MTGDTGARRLLRATMPGWSMLVTAVVATWPLATKLASSIPVGTEREATVPFFSLWNLWWTADRIPHAFRGFLDAPFFYPNPGVTTYSEPMPLLGVLVSPLWAAGTHPALIYNVALLAVLTLNGYFAYRVVRALEIGPVAAVAAGMATVTLPYTAHVFGVLPNIILFGMLWALDGLIRFGRTGTGTSAAWAAAGMLATFLTFQQYALFFAPIAVAGGVVALRQQHMSRPAMARLGAAGGLVLLAVLTLALPAVRLHNRIGGFERPAPVVRALSAQPTSYLTRPTTALVPVPPTRPADTGGLFPGFVLTGLAVAGAVVGFKDRARRSWTVVVVGAAAFGFVLSLGLRLDIAGWSPFGTLRGLFPQAAEIRSPYRAAAIVHLCLPLLAAFALDRLRPEVMRRAAIAVIAIAVIAAGENLAVPAALATVPDPAKSEWAGWIREQPRHEVLVHVPMPAALNVANYEIESRRLLEQTEHGKPIVNGYSGFFPVATGPDGETFAVYSQFQLDMARDFPSYDLICVLGRALGADTVVADRGWYEPREEQLSEFEDFLRPTYTDDDVRVYALDIPEGECRAGPPPDLSEDGTGHPSDEHTD